MLEIYGNASGTLLKGTAIVFFIYLVVTSPLRAQEARSQILSGSVFGAQAHEPLAGATIRVIGTTLGTATNADGRYRLLLAPGRYNLLVNYIGYISDTVHIDIDAQDVSVNIYLDQSEISLPEVLVYPASINPADEVISRAIAAKEKWLEKLHSYDFDAYTKTVLKVVKQGKGSDTTIGGILETQTSGYWKAPDFYREIVKARRQTANFTPAQNIFTAGRVVNFNDDIIKIDRYSIPGPISHSALAHYRYVIVDTNYQGETLILGIRVEPKRSPTPMFTGYIDIAQGSWDLVRARLSLSDQHAIEPLDSIDYEEQFAKYDDTYWLPIELKTSFAVKLRLPGVPPVFFDNVSVLYDYKINPEHPHTFFDQDLAAVSTKFADTDTAVWKGEQVLPLTHREAMAYASIDSTMKSLSFPAKTVMFLTRFLSEPDKMPFTSISDLYHFNRVEGSYLGVGLTSSKLAAGTEFAVIGGYGFSDRMWKYDLAAGYELPFARDVSVGGRVFRRLANREEEDMYSRFEITLGALLYKDDYRDYYLSRGWQASIDWRINSYLKGKATFNDERQTSVSRNTDYSIFPQNYDYRDNPAINEGNMRSVELSLNLGTRSHSDEGTWMQSDEGSSYWSCTGTAELSSTEFMRSSFSFDRFHLSLMRHQMTFASGFLNLWMIGGTAAGKLPPQRMFEIQAAYGGYSSAEVLSTLDVQRLLSTRCLVAGIEHDFASSLFRWSNIPVVRNAWFDVSLFVHGAVADGYIPMAEAGFGLVNILPFIRADFTWGAAGACRGFAWTVETTLDL